LSPIVGGGLAGYLEHHDGGRTIGVGALSGVLAMIPGLSILLFVTIGMFIGLSGIQASGLGIFTVTIMVLVMLFVTAYGAILGALGGLIGGRLAEST
ncbi:MAG: DUF5518 domain-containing protein, partial [Halobacteriaceae archaeon]